MNQLAALLSLALGIVALTIGVQRIFFNETMAAVAQRLGFPKTAFVILGALQSLLAVAALASIKGHKGGLEALSFIAGGGLTITSAVELLRTAQREGSRKVLLAEAGLLVAAALLVIARLSA